MSTSQSAISSFKNPEKTPIVYKANTKVSFFEDDGTEIKGKVVRMTENKNGDSMVTIKLKNLATTIDKYPHLLLPAESDSDEESALHA